MVFNPTSHPAKASQSQNHFRYLCLTDWKRGSSRSTILSDPRQRAANVSGLLPIIARNNSSTRDDRGTPTDLACPWAARITSRSIVRVSFPFNFRFPSLVNTRPIRPACVQAWMLHKRSQHLPCSVTPFQAILSAPSSVDTVQVGPLRCVGQSACNVAPCRELAHRTQVTRPCRQVPESRGGIQGSHYAGAPRNGSPKNPLEPSTIRQTCRTGLHRAPAHRTWNFPSCTRISRGSSRFDGAAACTLGTK